MTISVDGLIALVLGYLLGSIPFGLLLTRLAGAGDLRSIGSGNIGATNVLRTGRKDLAAATLVLDALKATLAFVLPALLFADESAGLAGAAAAFLGHVYPVWLRFRGGKGVATFLGGLIGAAWPAAIGFALVWLGVAAVTRYSSAAALAASLAAPIIALAVGQREVALVFGALAVLLWIKHAPNIERLRKGAESRIGAAAGQSKRAQREADERQQEEAKARASQQQDRQKTDEDEQNAWRDPTAGRMTQEQALEILELKPGATAADTRAAYNRLMQKVHPDTGGSTFFAKQLNLARDTLLRPQRAGS